ncbi:MAG: class I SAM-dependent methyltransferase [Candidatus Levybacteria bacterium]|nr:class I SAM-dependent methyltransferase [Candidatus Levybacteria bacterium]
MFSYILSYPLLSNYIRWVGTRDQPNTKKFIKANLEKYKASSVLDAGCGTGGFSETVPSGVGYLGIDINRKFIDYAIKKYQISPIRQAQGKYQKELKDKYSNVILARFAEAPARRACPEPIKKFQTGNIMDVEIYRNRQFDTVLLISMLHHFSDGELEIILPLIKRVTRKVVIIADIIPNPPNIFGKLLVKLDLGKFVRTKESKTNLINKYLKVVNTELIEEGFTVQYGIICEVN